MPLTLVLSAMIGFSIVGERVRYYLISAIYYSSKFGGTSLGKFRTQNIFLNRACVEKVKFKSVCPQDHQFNNFLTACR